ncbi:tRNA uracil 4-sulfurtransferase ThiI [Sediminibacillus albus]|uniref:Probable tRNA sulfurtransferase n=1 Tax=Sediminibacillus albus TaxID=407036 RepID=A0A1G9BVS0_9BACI|nr:tRNA uracil 4-sulfurtransferase ThiI [Sediminibacillus albus]SDK43571.1 thiamine biosynthesis protein ThiI [Sediminibacillus albus]
MQYEYIVLRYGEIALKGKNRKNFTVKLQENVRNKLKEVPDIKIKRQRDRMYVLLNGQDPEPIIEKCRHIFGIHSLSLAIKVENDTEEIKKAALFALEEADGVETFKITAKRTDKSFPIKSQDLNQVLGGYLLSNTDGYTVDVHYPDIELRVEVRQDGTYITSQKIAGAGGLPVGSSGKTLLLLSGGIDSPVAGYLTMKRGVQVEAVHFHSPPFTSERSKQKVFDLARKLTDYGHSIRIHVVPFTKLQQKIHQSIPHGYSMTVMRRMMMRVSEKIAEREGILSLTTGESLGQVASQTMESMHSINEVTNYPVLRPLIAMDKEDIIDISQSIDTYDISIRPYEDCCTVFVPNAPKTMPRREKVNQFEQSADFTEELNETLANIDIVSIKPASEEEREFSDLL